MSDSDNGYGDQPDQDRLDQLDQPDRPQYEALPAVPAAPHPSFPARVMALIKEGFVAVIAYAKPDGQHPFGDEADGHRVLDVTGTTCAVGYVADAKGNVAPPPPDGRPLLGHEPAYHDRTAGAPPIAAHANMFQTSGQDTNDAPVEEEAAAHPQAPFVQETPVKSETDPA